MFQSSRLSAPLPVSMSVGILTSSVPSMVMDITGHILSYRGCLLTCFEDFLRVFTVGFGLTGDDWWFNSSHVFKTMRASFELDGVGCTTLAVGIFGTWLVVA